MSIKLFILDDHELVRRGIKDSLWVNKDIIVVGEASSKEQALEAIPRCKPDVVLIDVRLGLEDDLGGLEVLKEIKSRFPEINFIVLTGFIDEDLVFESLTAGASAYVLKQVRGMDLADVIVRVANNEVLIDKEKAKQMVSAFAHEDDEEKLKVLSNQERKILDLIAQGKTNKEIGNELYLAEKTVKNYVSNLLAKLGMQRRSQAAAFKVRLEERKKHNNAAKLIQNN